MKNTEIDKLFKDKLQNFEATPTERVWNNIEANLKKRKRRIIPIWWFSGGIAAILILGVLVFYFSNDSVNKTIKSPIIITNTEINIPDLSPLKNKSISNEERIVTKKITVFNKNKSLQKEKIKETKVLVADKLIETERTTDKNRLENLTKEKYLASTTIKQNDSKNNQTKITEENILIKEDKELLLTNKNEKKYPKKDISIVLNNKDKREKNKNKKLWKISTVVAVLNANSFSNTSPISKKLGNSTRGDNSFSYGIQVAYQLDNKWSIQSGIHLQEMQYYNENVIINQASSSIANVSFNSENIYSIEEFTSDSFLLSTLSQDAKLSQEYGYVEIPIEIKYNILESKKFKTELVAGFSSLFLNKNSVNLKATNIHATGKVNNLNKINFSGNFGVDFNYQFHKKWSLNLNPMFKTQLKAFNKNAEGFKPYFIGIYTGINYQF